MRVPSVRPSRCETLTRLNEDFELRYGVVLATRTGINTGTVAGKGFVPTATSWPATPRTAQRVCSRTPTLARSSSPSRRSGSFAIRSAERLAAVDLRGKHEVITAYRLLAVGERSEVAPRLEAPLVGRQDALAQLDWALEQRSRRGAAAS